MKGANFSNHEFRTVAIIGLIAAMGATIIIYATAFGVGTDVDSASYLMAARSVVEGKGVVLQGAGDSHSVPLTAFPPLLPIVLGAIGALGIEPLHAARWLNAALFGADIFLIGWLVKRHTGSDLAAILGGALMATTADVVAIHCMVLSEPLFLFFVLVGLVFLMRYVERPSLALLVAFSTAFAAACGTRYIGVILIPIGAAVACFVPRQSRLKKIHLSVYLALFVSPAIFWALRNVTRAHTITNHAFSFHPPALNRIEFSYLSFSTWILPVAVPAILRVAVLAAIAGVALSPIWRRRVTQANSLKRIFDFTLLGLLCSYLLGFFVAQVFVDSNIWVTGRHLLFLFVIGSLLVISQLATALRETSPKSRGVAVGVCVAILALGALRTSRSALRTHQEGLGLSSKRWETSDLVIKVRQLDPGVAIISNSGAAIYLLTGTLTYPLSSAVSSPQINEDLNSGAIVVYFTAFQPPQITVPEENALEADLHLQRIASTRDGYLLARCASNCPGTQNLASKNAHF
jgi:hypothetical protein